MTSIGLNRRLLANLANRTTDMAAQEQALPAADFYCPQLFKRECQALFHNTPQPVAFAGEIPGPDSFLAIQVMDVPVLLTRNGSGQLRAFLNSCSHRGARVATGSGQRQSLVCPFHGWTYSVDGELRGRPQESAFTSAKKDCALTPLPVSEKYGVVVVAISSAVSQDEVDAALDEIGAEIGNFGFRHYQAIERRHYTVKANWKLVTDLSLESYHFNTLHRDSVAQVLAPNAVVDTYQRHSRWAFPLKAIERLAGLEGSEWPDTVEGSCTYTLYPGVMFIVNALGAQMIRAEPGNTPQESRLVYAGVCADHGKTEQARQAYEFGGDVFAGEDLPMAEDCQQGLKAQPRDLLLGRNETLLQFWHALWREALE